MYYKKGKTCQQHVEKEAFSRKLKPRAREYKGLPVGVKRGRVAPLEAAVQPQLPCPDISVIFGFYFN